MDRREFIQLLAGGALAAGMNPAIGAASESGPAGRSSGSKRPRRFGDGRDWFFENRFGLFLHWGSYAIPAWHEQHQWRARVPRSEYVKLAERWNPRKYDPDRWLDLMQDAGMKYVCITTKHHDGFCLWDTKETRFNTMNTPYKRDILGMLADACHRRRVPLCLYYSIADWNHPNYPNQGRHHELAGPEPGDQPDWDKYLEFLKAQVRGAAERRSEDRFRSEPGPQRPLGAEGLPSIAETAHQRDGQHGARGEAGVRSFFG